MSRGKYKKLKDLLVDANVLLDAFSIENRCLKIENDNLNKQVRELNESCENFTEVEINLHRKIDRLTKKPIGIKQRVLNFFS